MIRVERPKRFELRLSIQEAEQLNILADESGMSAADLIRYLLHKQWRKRPYKREE